MTLFTGSIAYILIWWLVLFTVLPWGIKPAVTPEAGFDPGAPENPRVLLKCAVTTVIAGVVWFLVYLLV
ncbi:MAG: DUF1467 family protein [Pseudomonadota bacterium]